MRNNEGITMDSQEEIGEFLLRHYSEKFKRVEHDIDWDLIHTMPHIISEADNVALTALPTAQEIKAVVFLLNADSSPGPGGFTGFFFHHCWDIVEYDVVRAIRYFFRRSSLPFGFNSNFIVLIPKERNANQLVKRKVVADDDRVAKAAHLEGIMRGESGHHFAGKKVALEKMVLAGALEEANDEVALYTSPRVKIPTTTYEHTTWKKQLLRPKSQGVEEEAARLAKEEKRSDGKRGRQAAC
ncbi:hypothetical protein IFM89_000849 [Coptis chinensis]|uniref:Uncharacterized protein n=1 Tax=Coptis chinensis TaxID=261450 RepID=A0A835IQP4_9MAGN|nr:hypothetical protein IFM89_000849 [Coptis chinensis]